MRIGGMTHGALDRVPLPTIAVLIIVILVLSSLACVMIEDRTVSADRDKGTSLTAGSRILNVAVVNMDSQLMTLNPLKAGTAAERMVIWSCYSTLLKYAPNETLTGDLATSWNLSLDGRSWRFSLSHSALFYNKNSSPATHPVTAQDVKYTYWLVQNQSVSLLNPYFIDAFSRKVISQIWTPNDFEIYINVTEPYAPIEEAFSVIPILPEHIWSSRVWDWANYGGAAAVCVGSGPLYYSLPGRPIYGFVPLNRSLTWFHEQEDGWRIQVDQVRYLDYASASAAWTDLTSVPQVVDIMLGMNASSYVNDLPLAQSITGWNPESGLIYALDVNQMTTALRNSLGYPYTTRSNNQLLLNNTVKWAIAMCINRTAFIADSLQGMADSADSIIPLANNWHFGNSAVIQFDPEAARAMLMAAGWAYDSAGSPASPTTTPLCNSGGASPLVFRIMTTTDSPEYAEFVAALAASAQRAGLQLDVSVHSDVVLYAELYRGNYDLCFWSFDDPPTSDPDPRILEYFTTMQIGADNWNFFTSPEFDQQYNDSVGTSNSTARRTAFDQMQTLLYENLTNQPVAYGFSFYAANNQTWVNYGNWTEQPLLAPDLALPWLYLRIELRNDAPHDLSISIGPSTVSAGETVWYNGSAVDDNGDALFYHWDFGDLGEATGQNATHVYSLPGSYHAILTVTDAFGHASSYEISVDVGTAIPEFGVASIVTVVLLTTITLTMKKRRRKTL